MSPEDQLLHAFEESTLDANTFRHSEHVRLAYAYLRRFDLVEALARYRRGLKRFAARNGAPGKYHETVTCALVILIHERMALRSGANDWEAFAAANPDLLRWRGGAFFDYYDADVLESEIARRTFVLPRPAGRQRSAVPVGPETGDAPRPEGEGVRVRVVRAKAHR